MALLKLTIIRVLSLLHFLIVAFVVFGCLSRDKHVLLFHLIFLPMLVLHWKTNAGVCYLTQIENKIQGKTHQKVEMQGGFTEVLFTKLFRKKPTREFLQNLIYCIMALSWMISILKYIN